QVRQGKGAGLRAQSLCLLLGELGVPGNLAFSPATKCNSPSRRSGSSCQRNGAGGIRTHGTVTRTRDFQSRSFGHSDTAPKPAAIGRGERTQYRNGLGKTVKRRPAGEIRSPKSE